jgi:bacteriocin biosynthesis cyclodehydratase domain-containing protein
VTGGKEVTADDHRDDEPDRARVELRDGQLRSAGGTRFRLEPSIELFPASTGDLFLLRPGEAGDLVIRQADAVDRALVEALADDAATLEGLTRACGGTRETVAEKLGALEHAGVLQAVDGERVALPAGLAARVDRQLPYLAEHGDPGAAQLRLRAATVAVLGCGGLGTWALGALAGAGIGRFVLIDDDVVELSNLNRQVLYGVADVGLPKADRAAAWLRRFDPGVDVAAHRRRIGGAAELRRLLAGADLLVQTADSPPYAIVRWVDEACRALGISYVLGGQRPPVLRVGPTIVPGRTACFTCRETALRREFPLYGELSALRDAAPPRATTLGPASGIAGALVALQAMHALLGRPVPTEGRALLVDMRTLDTTWERWEPLPGCPACHHPAGDD